MDAIPISTASHGATRDAMLSHSSLDVDIVATLDRALRGQTCSERELSIWLDDRQIEGGSVVAAINDGLETSRHVVLCLTPNYFASRSGWTYAEWMAGLYEDPAGRIDRVIPVMLADVRLPALLRHLDTIDLRPAKRARRPYETEFARLVRRICAQGRAAAASGGRADQQTIERAISIPGPDAVPETLITNLLPAIRVPDTVVVASIAPRLNAGTLQNPVFPSESGLRDLVIAAARLAGRRFPPAFRRVGDELVSFVSPGVDRVFATVADEKSFHHESLRSWSDDSDGRSVVVSLLNAGVRDVAAERHLTRHRRHAQRFYFERNPDGTDRKIQWRGSGKPFTVTRALVGKTGATRYWLHRAIEANVEFFERSPYLQLHPTIVLTRDGTASRVLGGPVVADYGRAYVSRERNGHLHRHVLYWISVFGDGTEAIQVPVGDQLLIFDSRAARATLPVGIAHDQVKIKGADLQDAFIGTRVGEESGSEDDDALEGLDELAEFVDEESSESTEPRRIDRIKEVRHDPV